MIFLLGVDELDIVSTARNSEKLYFSSFRVFKNNVIKIIRKVLNDKGIGFGGGHPHMAGGIINHQFQKMMN